MIFDECPRCGHRALERLETYSHCLECRFSPGIDEVAKRYEVPGLDPRVLKIVRESEKWTNGSTDDEENANVTPLAVGF